MNYFLNRMKQKHQNTKILFSGFDVYRAIYDLLLGTTRFTLAGDYSDGSRISQRGHLPRREAPTYYLANLLYELYENEEILGQRGTPVSHP